MKVLNKVLLYISAVAAFVLICGLVALVGYLSAREPAQPAASQQQIAQGSAPIESLELIAGASQPTHEMRWEGWKTKHHKMYRTRDDHAFRRSIFEDNARLIEEFNRAHDTGNPGHDLVLDLNQFADMSNQEFSRYIIGPYWDLNDLLFNNSDSDTDPDSAPRLLTSTTGLNSDPPASVDWRDRGAVSPVQDQGNCGSCWTFSVVGMCEGAHVVGGHELVRLSQQQLLDCSTRRPNAGCEGGDTVSAMKDVIKTGLQTFTSYPYKGTQGTCDNNPDQTAAYFDQYLSVDPGDENKLVATVAQYGPLSVAVDAGPFAFQFYHSGVFKDSSCNSKRLNHGVVLVGYNRTDSGEDYYIVKNSWGTSWGEGGYYRLARNSNNMCGIATYAIAAVARPSKSP